tara:strand:+ start:93 stop:527 length:435 start_codon:yes stop_codon:yes gene_type:complete
MNKIIEKDKSIRVIYEINTSYKTYETFIHRFKNYEKECIETINKDIDEIIILNFEFSQSLGQKQKKEAFNINFQENNLLYKPIYLSIYYTFNNDISIYTHRTYIQLIKQIIKNYIIQIILNDKIKDLEKKVDKKKKKKKKEYGV